MGKSVAVYYSSSAESGNTARLLASFMRGIERGGDTTETFAVKDLNISPCTGALAWHFARIRSVDSGPGRRSTVMH
jgi:multimeric flavodoxin WrbA